jgi:hypothetical protein
LTRRLRTGRPLRKRRRSPVARTPRFVAPGRLIDERPVVVERRTRIGDWEGDLIVGRMSRSAIGTLVDRRTGYLRLVHLPDGHTAEQLRVGMLPVLTRLPALARQTLTWDQGSEMACHDLLAEYFADGIFFAIPAVPGCVARTRTPTGCSASTSARAAICGRSPSPIYARSSIASTTGPASASAGAARHKRGRPNWHSDVVIVATTKRIRPGTHPPPRGQLWAVVDHDTVERDLVFTTEVRTPLESRNVPR